VRDGAVERTPGRGRRTHDGYRHEAFFWDGDEQFLAGTVPFVTEGLAVLTMDLVDMREDLRAK
jgi:hypothetical protein